MTRCKKGFILRQSYTRKQTRVPSACIRSTSPAGEKYSNFQTRVLRGKKRGTRAIGPLRKGLMAKYGYVNIASLTEKERHSALARAIKEYGSLSTWKKINVLSIFVKNKNPGLKAKYNSDKDWIKGTYGLKAF